MRLKYTRKDKIRHVRTDDIVILIVSGNSLSKHYLLILTLSRQYKGKYKRDGRSINSSRILIA